MPGPLRAAFVNAVTELREFWTATSTAYVFARTRASRPSATSVLTT